MDPNDEGPCTSKQAMERDKKAKMAAKKKDNNDRSTKSTIPIRTEEYLGWKLYFFTENFVSGSILHDKIMLFENHIAANPEQYDLFKTKQELWFPVVFQFIVNDEQIQLKWSSFEQDIRENPRDTLNCLGLAMHQRCLSVPDRVGPSAQSQPNPSSSSSYRVAGGPSPQSQPNPTSSLSLIPPPQRTLPARPFNLHMKCIVARLTGCGPIVNLRSLIVANYGRLITVRGTIIRVNQLKYICSWLAFQCSTCSASQTIKLIDGIMAYPKSCKTTGCRARNNFQLLKKSPYTRTETLQTLRLQESMQCVESGRVPSTVEIEIKQDLVDSICPGDDVTVAGILNFRLANKHQYRKTLLKMSK